MTQKKAPSGKGWISIDRDIIDSRLFSRSGNHVKIALYLMLCANHKPKFHRGIEIERGQCVRSLTQISEACDVSRKAVRCAIENMVKDEFIIVDEPFGAHKGHRITVCNYNTYQSEDFREGTDGAHQGHTKGTLTPTNKKDKNEKNVKKFIPPSVDDVRKYITERGKIDPSEAERFCDFYESKGWMVGKNKMKEWKACVRNWESNRPMKPKKSNTELWG